MTKTEIYNIIVESIEYIESETIMGIEGFYDDEGEYTPRREEFFKTLKKVLDISD